MARWLLFLIFSLLAGLYFLYPLYKSPNIITIYPELEPTKLRPADLNGYIETESFVNYSLEPEKPLLLNENQVEDIFNTTTNIIEKDSKSQLMSESGLNIIKIENKNDNLQQKHQNCYRLQLATVKDRDMAISIWKNYKNKFPDILKNMDLILKKIDQENGKFYFLVLTGEYDNIVSARRVCNKLLNHKQTCIIFKDY